MDINPNSLYSFDATTKVLYTQCVEGLLQQQEGTGLNFYNSQILDIEVKNVQLNKSLF